jgi:hypothetical protein
MTARHNMKTHEYLEKIMRIATQEHSNTLPSNPSPRDFDRYFVDAFYEDLVPDSDEGARKRVAIITDHGCSLGLVFFDFDLAYALSFQRMKRSEKEALYRDIGKRDLPSLEIAKERYGLSRKSGFGSGQSFAEFVEMLND